MLGSSAASITSGLVTPTTCLPSSQKFQATSLNELRSCVEYLRFLYTPEVRGSRRRKTKRGLISDEQRMSDRLSTIRADTFERSHSIRWLTSLVARCDDLAIHAQGSSDVNDLDEQVTRESLVEDAAALLAACAGTASSGRVSRMYTFGPTPAGESVSLTLTDAPLENGDYATVGAQTWGGACVMADIVFENPEQFGLRPGQSGNEAPLRILELGAGTGLVGLSISKLLELRQVSAEVVLTDFHPSVLANLRSNVASTFPPRTTHSVNVSIDFLDWSTYPSPDAPETLGTFDLIVGADIVYESRHALWIRSCLERLLRPAARFHLVIPLRRTHTVESSTVERVFGENATNCKFKILHHEQFSCDPYIDTGSARGYKEDVDYAYFQIGWKDGSDAEKL